MGVSLPLIMRSGLVVRSLAAPQFPPCPVILNLHVMVWVRVVLVFICKRGRIYIYIFCVVFEIMCLFFLRFI